MLHVKGNVALDGVLILLYKVHRRLLEIHIQVIMTD